jgi:hypothetical protein
VSGFEEETQMATVTRSEITGRCFCGTVAFSAGPALYAPTLCHCASCRRASGAHAVGWVTVAAEQFEFVQGEPRVYHSSRDVTRTFCGTCGSPLTYQHQSRGGEIDITIGTLDAPDDYAPVDHIWMEDALGWDRPGDGLPQLPQRRGG